MRVYMLTCVSQLTIVESPCRRRPNTAVSSTHHRQDFPDPFWRPEFHDEASLERLDDGIEPRGFGPKQMTSYPQQQM